MATRVGLKIPGPLPFDEWEQAGLKIFRIAESSCWCLGDWLLYGKSRYSDRYRKAIEAAGLDYQTLRNYAWVARQFELWRRRENLSFQHHAEVAGLPSEEQDQWLDRAEREGWSRNKLRDQLRASRGDGVERPGPGTAVALPKVSVPHEHIALWRDAALRSGIDFKLWLIKALDEAAASELEFSGDQEQVKSAVT
ncbi:LmbU family transcriptional regulator [Streptomyces sp. 6N223]